DTDSLKVQALVEAGELDFGLGAFFKNTAGMEVAPLFQYELMWITPRKRNKQIQDKHRPPSATASTGRSGLATVSWSDLADTPIIGLPPENKIQQAIETSLEAIGRAHEN